MFLDVGIPTSISTDELMLAVVKLTYSPEKVNLNIRYVPRCKHFSYVIKTNQLMVCREIISVSSQIHTKHINTLCGQNVVLLNVKLVVHIVTTGL